MMTAPEVAAKLVEVIDWLDTPERRGLCPSKTDNRLPLLDELIVLADRLDPPKEE